MNGDFDNKLIINSRRMMKIVGGQISSETKSIRNPGLELVDF